MSLEYVLGFSIFTEFVEIELDRLNKL